jgi:hypothetical protein
MAVHELLVGAPVADPQRLEQRRILGSGDPMIFLVLFRQEPS